MMAEVFRWFLVKKFLDFCLPVETLKMFLFLFSFFSRFARTHGPVGFSGFSRRLQEASSRGGLRGLTTAGFQLIGHKQHSSAGLAWSGKA
jgi:hypothetical protein